MVSPNARPANHGGPGGGAGDFETPSIHRAAKDYQCERACLLAIAALVLAHYAPRGREWRIIRRSARRCFNIERQLGELLIEAVAPSRECADPARYWALTREQDASAIIAARMRGYMPEPLIEAAAKAAAAAVFGASVTIQRRPKAETKAREINALADLMRGGTNAA